MNTIVVNGNIGADPKLLEYQKGKFLVSFSLAEKWYNFNTKERDTTWFRVIAFGAVATRLAKLVKKGDKISIVGQVRLDRYEKDGKEFINMQITMSDFDLISTKEPTASMAVGEEPEQPYEEEVQTKTEDDGLPF